MGELMSGRHPIGGPFTLADPSGQRVALADFKGKFVLLYFGYASCPDVCPTDLAVIAQALRELGPAAAGVQPLFVTLDPQRDSPAVLREYTAAFDPRFIALTGTEDEVRRVATDFKVFFEKVDLPGTKTYARWHKAVVEYYRGEIPPHGAIWMVYYPNIMLEWYPHVLVVSTLIPRSVDRTTNVVEFYYPEDIVHFERELVEAERAAYMETAIEDDEIAKRMDRGRRALYQRGESEVGPYQSPMEDGMMYFHEYIRRGLAGNP